MVASVEVPTVFKWLDKLGNIGATEMLRTFNCGVGMIVVVAEDDTADVMKALKRAGESVAVLGTLASSRSNAPQVNYSGTLGL